MGNLIAGSGSFRGHRDNSPRKLDGGVHPPSSRVDANNQPERGAAYGQNEKFGVTGSAWNPVEMDSQ